MTAYNHPGESRRLHHEWDDDACCIHCGYDGAEVAHLVKLGAYERTAEDRWCEERERKARSDMRNMSGRYVAD